MIHATQQKEGPASPSTSSPDDGAVCLGYDRACSKADSIIRYCTEQVGTNSASGIAFDSNLVHTFDAVNFDFEEIPMTTTATTTKEQTMIHMKPKPTPATPSVLTSIIVDRLSFMEADIAQMLSTVGGCLATNRPLTELKKLAADTSEIAQALESMLSRAEQ